MGGKSQREAYSTALRGCLDITLQLHLGKMASHWGTSPERPQSGDAPTKSVRNDRSAFNYAIDHPNEVTQETQLGGRVYPKKC